MTPYERGDIVLVPFPFSDQSATKKRPAVVVSSSAYNAASPDIVIMAVTSQTQKSTGMGECMIIEWRAAGLLKPSAIKSALSTIEQSLVLKKLGKLSFADITTAGNALKELLDLE
jgi:mRNA interferase MazF